MGLFFLGITPLKYVSGKWDSDPRPSAWEADVLPLNYYRKIYVGAKIINICE